MNTITAGLGSLTLGESAVQSSKINAEKGTFEKLLSELKSHANEESGLVGKNLSSSQVLPEGKINGDWHEGYSGTFKSESDKKSAPRGAAANQANPHVQSKTIDRTSKLYEKSLEMESYMVKMMLSQMRKTVVSSTEKSYGQKMYEDMLWDEYATKMTKNAGFGLADQMYLQLSQDA